MPPLSHFLQFSIVQESHVESLLINPNLHYLQVLKSSLHFLQLSIAQF
jgi:hypothetical protein